MSRPHFAAFLLGKVQEATCCDAGQSACKVCSAQLPTLAVLTQLVKEYGDAQGYEIQPGIGTSFEMTKGPDITYLNLISLGAHAVHIFQTTTITIPAPHFLYHLDKSTRQLFS